MTVSKATTDTLVEDIYSILDNGMDITDEQANEFGKEVAELIKSRLSEIKRRKAEGTQPEKLRLSGIGKPDYQLWLASRGTEKEGFEPFVMNKFIFGDLTEAYLLFLTKLAGHTVEDEQKEVRVEGIKGHIDCTIDGKVIDVKSASPYAFKKFQDGTYLDSGGFGSSYKYQIASYHQAAGKEGEDEAGFLAMNKVNGQIHLMMVDDMHLPNPSHRIEHLKKMLDEEECPESPYKPVPDGLSGNMKLSTEASYCPYKWHMYPDLRCFLYSNGPRYLTHVEREPKDTIPEINMKGEIINHGNKEEKN